MINVTKSFLPDKEIFLDYVNKIWASGHLTNHGPLVLELEEKLKEYLGVRHFFFMNNGTIALQIAIKALGLKGQIITTPFSYVATTSSIVWENCEPVFADIDPFTLTIDIKEIEKKITSQTSAILVTHVYGYPCDVDAIKKIADKHKIKVIYDAAHAFGVTHNNVGILNFGDVSSLSFHATKLFHTIEGGGLATNDDELAHKISYMRNFGHNGPEKFFGVGINGKASEFNAAMGLSIFPSIESILKQRAHLAGIYDSRLLTKDLQIKKPVLIDKTVINHSYYPVVFESEVVLLEIVNHLNEIGVFPRRYFYPSLNTLNYISEIQPCPVSENISERVLCLPIYPGLPDSDVNNICDTIIKAINHSSL